MRRNSQHYWDDIRKTLILYSLVPALSLLLIGAPLLYWSFSSALCKTSADNNIGLAREFETVLVRQADTVATLSELDSIQKMFLEGGSAPTAAIYAEIYALLKDCVLMPDCFVVDPGGNVLLSTRTVSPEYINGDSFSQVGIGRRMTDNPEQIIVERYASSQRKEISMCVGKAVERDGKIIGYVITGLSDDAMLQLLLLHSSSPSAVTDRFGYLFAGTVSDTLISHNKLISPLRNETGNVTVDGRRQYVSAQPILDGRVVVYTIIDIGYLDVMFVRLSLLFLGMAVVFTVLLLITLQGYVRRKSKILNDMVSAVRLVQNGDLTKRLEVDSQDEFQIFAEEYNRMLTDLDKLMQINSEIARQTVISEVKQLESQFNPHFLYNTLGTVKYMIELAPKDAQKMIANISEILRYSIRTESSQIRFEEDLQYTQNYMEIMQYRHRNILRFVLEIEPDTLDCMVPKLIIQPIIENAIEHGFKGKESLTISVCAALLGKELLLEITNDGTGMDKKRLAEIRGLLAITHDSSRHIGLYNVHRRIQLLHGAQYGLEIESTQNTGTKVLIRLPA